MDLGDPVRPAWGRAAGDLSLPDGPFQAAEAFKMTEREDGEGLQLRRRILHGIDVVSISRLQERLDEWPKLAGRIFTTAELAYAQSRPHPAEHLAVRFAAKEATFKALGSGWPRLSWLDVEVVSDGNRPSINLSGQAKAKAAGYEASVSLSHDAGVAAAQVLLLPAD